MRLSLLCGSFALALSGCDLSVDLGISAKLDAGSSVDTPGAPQAGAGGDAAAPDAGSLVDSGALGDSGLRATCSTGVGTQAGSPWPMEGRCPTRQGQTSQVAAQTSAIKWTYDAAAEFSSCGSCTSDLLSVPSIAADGTVYVVAGTQLVALHANGAVAWSAPLNAKAYGAPVIGADGTIYAAGYGTPGQTLVGALSAFTPGGALKWSYAGPNFSRAPSIAADGTLYVPTVDGKLYAVRSDGTLAWTFTAGASIFSSPAIGPGGIVYFGSKDGVLHAVAHDGAELWSYSSGAPIGPVVVGSDGTLYALNTKLLAVSPAGALLWSFAPPLGASPGGVAIAPDGTIRLVADSLIALTPAGAMKWAFLTGTVSWGAGAVDGVGTALFQSGDFGGEGRFYAIDAAGVQKWSLTLPQGGGSPPAIGADGTVYVASGTKLYAVGP